MAKNDFLPFATADGANVLSAEDYQTLPARSNGFSAGVARSQELNTVWRQASVIAHVVAQFIADTNNRDVADDGDLQTLQDGLRQALSQHINHRVKPASLTIAGIAQLSSATDSDSETMAATPKAVKAAMDLAASSAVKSVNGKKGEVQLTAGDVGALAQTGGTVNGPMTVEGNAKFTGTDYLDKSGVITDKKNTVRETNGLRIRGIEGQRADLRYWEKIGQGASLKLNVISGKSNGEFDFRQNGEFRASGGATFGGNVHVSWGGRSAIFHENGDATGPIWGGSLSGYIEKKINSVRKRTREVVVWSGIAGTGSTVTTSEDILGALIYLRCPGWDPKNNNYAQVMVPFTVGKATLVSMPRGGWLTIKVISARELEIFASSVDFNEILLSE